MTRWIPPMLAQLAKRSPIGGDWVFERKLDGLRCIAIRNRDDVTLWSRNQLSFTERFPGLVQAVAAIPADDFMLDGEIVAFDAQGRTSFSLLQQRGQDSEVQLHLFDVIQLLGERTTSLQLLQRKELLNQMIPESNVLKTVPHIEGTADELLASACASGWEGLIAKRATSIYKSGRSPDWLKLKCTSSQELVIGGWTEPRGSRTGFGALLVGYYENSTLHFAGKVGTGFTTETLKSLYTELKTRETRDSPFDEIVKEKTAHWTQPELVANIGFSEWTNDGKLRHPTFQGLRPDKSAKTVTRES